MISFRILQHLYKSFESLAQISLIKITLKWHYMNMCDKFDSFHSFNIILFV